MNDTDDYTPERLAVLERICAKGNVFVEQAVIAVHSIVHSEGGHPGDSTIMLEALCSTVFSGTVRTQYVDEMIDDFAARLKMRVHDSSEGVDIGPSDASFMPTPMMDRPPAEAGHMEQISVEEGPGSPRAVSAALLDATSEADRPKLRHQLLLAMHGMLLPQLATAILKSTHDLNAPTIECMPLLTALVASVIINAVEEGGDDKALEVLVSEVKRKLTESRPAMKAAVEEIEFHNKNGPVAGHA